MSEMTEDEALRLALTAITRGNFEIDDRAWIRDFVIPTLRDVIARPVEMEYGVRFSDEGGWAVVATEGEAEARSLAVREPLGEAVGRPVGQWAPLHPAGEAS